jgi:pimeloyl-ACP methyl ester carboxylesterase
MFEAIEGVAAAAGGLMTAGGVGYAALAVVGAERFTPAKREASGFTPRAAGMAYEDVRFHARADEVRLAAWYLGARRPRGAVILVHGRGASKGNELNMQAMALVRRLLDSELSVLMLDLRGHGDSDAARLTYGCNERLDVLGAVDWLIGRGYRPGTIGVLGASMGGSAAIAAAAEEPAIGAVVSDSAFADFAAVLRHNFPRVMRTRLALALLPGALWWVRRWTGVALQRFRPAELVRALQHRPLLLIHSRGDRFVTAEHAERLAAASGTEAWVSDTEGHVATFMAQPQEYGERVGGFFSRHLAGAA